MTENHDYTTPEQGATNWHNPINRNFSLLDADVEIRDQAANRDQYDPKDGAKFLATDTGERYIGDGSQWEQLPYPSVDGGGSSDSSDGGSAFGGSRPAVSTDSISVEVDSDGGDYESIQAAIDNELPWLIRHSVDIRIGNGSYDEDLVIPPYMANWTEHSSDGERVPIQITGDTGDPDSVEVGSAHAAGGVGVCQLRGLTFTRSAPWDDESSAVASYNTYRLSLIDCNVYGGENAMLAYNGHLKATRVDVGDGVNSGWGIKVKNWGRYWESNTGTSGRVGGPAYEVDAGHINFNHRGDGGIDGDPQVNASNTSDGGFVLDEGNACLYGPNAFAMKDAETGQIRRLVIEDGNVTVQ